MSTTNGFDDVYHDWGWVAVITRYWCCASFLDYFYQNGIRTPSTNWLRRQLWTLKWCLSTTYLGKWLFDLATSFIMPDDIEFDMYHEFRKTRLIHKPNHFSEYKCNCVEEAAHRKKWQRKRGFDAVQKKWDITRVCGYGSRYMFQRHLVISPRFLFDDDGFMPKPIKFGECCNATMRLFVNPCCIDFIFDSYIKGSVKDSERQRRILKPLSSSVTSSSK